LKTDVGPKANDQPGVAEGHIELWQVVDRLDRFAFDPVAEYVERILVILSLVAGAEFVDMLLQIFNICAWQNCLNRGTGRPAPSWPDIHDLLRCAKNVDARHKAGHDEKIPDFGGKTFR